MNAQAEIFPDKNHGGRTFYYEAIMSAMKIPQVQMSEGFGLYTDDDHCL